MAEKAEKLTPQQRAAVEDRGRSLLVSAAAGSGKTKVLVERLFSYVENEGADLDDFLIITYTRAAAAELRGKIAKALSERLESGGAGAHLRRQMLRVYRADIKTVDAFCTALLRENCHLLPTAPGERALRPDFRVLDEQDAAALRRRVLTRVMDQFYENPGEGGLLLADTLGRGRDDSALFELVLELHAKLQAQPRREAWLREQERQWQNVPDTVDGSVYAAVLLSALRAKALHWSGLLREGAAEMSGHEALALRYAPAFAETAAQLEHLARAAERGWDDARGAFFAFPRLGAVRDSAGGELKARMKSLWDACKMAVKKLEGRFDASAAESAEDLARMSGAMLALLRLTGEFSRAYQAEKRRRNAADFSDQEHEAIRLLEDADGRPSELAHTVSLRYREIMVDEFQDTNEVQNRIFDAISRGGRNLFTVGDVKQSIYRFRLADPGIFLHRYAVYPDASEAGEGESAKLLLSRNFRSRREVLEAVNYVFAGVLSREMGELDYGEAEALYPGASYDERGDRQCEFHLLDLPAQHGAERVSAAEAEAGFVASRIRRLIDEGFPVLDDETRRMRPVREEDVVILMRSPRTRTALIRRALEARGLRCAAEGSDGFFDTVEIATVFSLLQIIDNPRQDVPLIAVLRSPLFGFSPDRLARLRANRRDGDFYDTLLADEGEDVKAFLALLGGLRECAQYMDVYTLLAEIYERCSAPEIFGAMPGGEERRENLTAFFSLCEQFEQSGARGLFAFVTHLRELLESGETASPRAPRAAGGVRLMSIHKSKGLEFPVVILADLARNFSNMDFSGPVLVHPKLGVGPICVDTARRIKYPTAARLALEQTLRRETKAEELRLLYVAMTRAKEKLILVHTQSNAGKRLSDLAAAAAYPVRPESVDEGKCLGDWVMLPLLCRTEAEPLRALAGTDVPQRAGGEDTPWLVETHDALADAPQRAADAPGGAAEPRRPELPFDPAALTFRYPYERETGLPAKLTATQLKGRERDAEIAENAAIAPRLRALEKPRFLTPGHALTPAERGTATHLAMQYLDFSAASGREELEKRLASLVARRLLTEEQAAAVNRFEVLRFLNGPLAARIRANARVEREYRFSLLRSVREYDASAASDDDVLVQGVVDCFFEEDGALVVVDFKTDRVNAETQPERVEAYRMQLETYAAALSAIWGMEVREKLLYFFATGDSVTL